MECKYCGGYISNASEQEDCPKKPDNSKSDLSDGLWRTMDTAPKDMTEILGWREDAGAMLIRYAAPIDFLTESELEEIGEEAAEAADWFYADFVQGGRLEGSEAPTHWMPLPDAP